MARLSIDLDLPIESLADDYRVFIDTLGEDEREAFEAGGVRTAFSMYAEMRINGFERDTAVAPGP